AMVVSTVSDRVAPFQVVWVDDVQVTLCDSNPPPQGHISGQVVGPGASAPDDALLVLAHTATSDINAPPEGVYSTYPNYPSAGSYTFDHVGAIPVGDDYQVWYLNDGTETGRLAYWAGERVSNFDGSSTYTVEPIDVSGVTLGAPAYNGQATLPTTFTW